MDRTVQTIRYDFNFCLCRSLKEQLLEKKDPYEVYPTENYARGNSYEDTYDQSDKTALLCEGAPSYNKLGDPVNTGNDEKQKLHETALFVKPSHFIASFYVDSSSACYQTSSLL